MRTLFIKPLTFTSGQDVQHTFDDVEGLLAFIDAEQDFWQPIIAPAAGSPTLSGEARYPFDRLSALRNGIVSFQAGSMSPEDLAAQFQQTFGGKDRPVPLSSSRIGRELKEMVASLPTDAAAACLATFFRQLPEVRAPNLTQHNFWLGTIAALNIKLGLSAGQTAAAAASLDDLNTQYSNKLGISSQNMSKEQERWRIERDAATSIANNSESERGTEFRAQMDAWKIELEENRETWRKTLNAFVEQLHLKAPKEYWETKRAGHKRRALVWGGVSAIYAVVALLFMVNGLDTEYTKLIELAAEPPIGAYVALGARGLVISVVVFWIGRVLVRMFLSELHLGMDAYERSTMVSTYLALTNEGSVSKDERALVLAPLFRPTSDGIVKDDASLDPTIFALLGKAPPKTP